MGDKQRKVLINDSVESDIDPALFVRLLLLEYRIYKMMLALKNYGVSPRYYEGLDIIDQAFKKAFRKLELGESCELRVSECAIPILEKKTLDEIRKYFGLMLGMAIQKEDILDYCHKGCGYLVHSLEDDYMNTERGKDEFKHWIDILFAKSNEAIGYWTAKLEMMKQNKDNVKPRTTAKEKHKAELKKWMKTMSKKECRLKAQKEFDVTDRTALNYLKEIKNEETAFLRKKDDIT